MKGLTLDIPVLDWLMNGEVKDLTTDLFVAGLAEKLQDSGVAVRRIAFFVRSLHPTIMGGGYVWDRDGGVQNTQVGYDVRGTGQYQDSPIAAVFEAGEGFIRHRLEPGHDVSRYPILSELQGEGATDYLMYDLPFMRGAPHAVSFVTDAPGGYDERAMAILEAIRRPVARIAEILNMHLTASHLLDTYLGPGTGEHVLNGQIKRGDGERIRAVVCFCDLRESSRLAEEFDMEGFLAALNEFYDCTAAPILEEGGEILRFIGDAYLGIFPLAAFDSETAACRAALSAAEKGIDNLRSRATDWKLQGKPVLKGGFGLHVGEVMYGNIGTAERLEFTVIGRTANEAARLEGQCREQGEPVLVSEAFASRLPAGWRDLGTFSPRNISRPMRLFAPEVKEGRGDTQSR